MREVSKGAVLVAALLCVACGSSERRSDVDGGAGTADVGTLDASTGDAIDGDTVMPACVSAVPCSSDSQCVALAGNQCNLGLSPPHCQRSGCGAEGDPCAAADRGSHVGTGTEQALCASRACRHPEIGAWTCRVAPLSASECSVICAASRQASSCDVGPCDATCAKALTECAAHEGLSDVAFGSICSAAAVRTCGDGTLLRF